MKYIILIFALALCNICTAQLELDKVNRQTVLDILDKKSDMSVTWDNIKITSDYIEINDTKYLINWSYSESVANASILIVSDNCTVRLIFLNEFTCAAMITKYCGVTLRSYMNQDKL